MEEIMTEIKWKYFEKISENSLKALEDALGITLPKDYREMLQVCNAAKPKPSYFDIHNRRECIVDYMLNINSESSNSLLRSFKTLKTNSNGKILIPIAIDPFGNFIAYNFSSSKDNPEIVFWDHETSNITFIARNFKTFLSLLY
jgi:hypothetical protein